MEIINKTENCQLGDVLKEEGLDNYGLIVKDNDGNFVLMDISPYCNGVPTFTTEKSQVWEGPYAYLESLINECEDWHKVNAKLVIE
ncbi:hypothetical protein [uncultured Lactobacillus sp.]|uniref:hypothetical protein n=1 Tax=uncultured Lactobacillus sp. TaxID=153152 RepID=UPI002629072C|nr:hypothetical protein [uncultured Lactobacillus sp.]